VSNDDDDDDLEEVGWGGMDWIGLMCLSIKTLGGRL
jgi:hypothetical protein